MSIPFDEAGFGDAGGARPENMFRILSKAKGGVTLGHGSLWYVLCIQL